MHDHHDQSPSFVYVPSETTKRPLIPHRLAADIRRRQVWEAMLNWDTLDNGLQTLRFIALWLHANFRVAKPTTYMSATLSPIVFLTTRTVRRPRRIALGKGTALASEAIANVRRFALLLLWAYTGSQHVMERLAYHAADEEHPGQVDRIMTLGDVVANVGEAFDVLAFLSGSGLFWSVLGGWTLRRRHGLERVGVFVSLASLVIHLYGLHRRRIEITEEMLESTRVVQNQLDTYDRMALRKEPASAQDVSMAEATVQDEYEQYITNKRRMRWLGMEQIRVVSDASFTLYEACAPDADTNMLEASAGLVTGVLGLLRQWHEARYGSLDI